MELKQHKRLKHSRYITGFDGIRALGVLAVIIYHLLPYKLQGGYLGVPIFFTVSGYLITDLLLQEWQQNGSINILSFYFRRMRRLYPALVTMVLTTAAYITIFERSMMGYLRSIILTNLTYVYNWWEILHGQNYFDRFQGESPFVHLWSLSIEGQYYLIWPVVLFVMIMLLRNRRRIFYVLISIICASGLLMAGIYFFTHNVDRVYYGTDTRLYSIVFGVALAMIWPITKLPRIISKSQRYLLDGAGILSIIVLIIMCFFLSGQSDFTYYGGMFIVSFFATILVATCAHPGADINRLLTNPLFHWMGTRSYGIYLYQFPVMIFYESKIVNIGEHPIINAAVEAILIMVISELSYRYIEQPLRHYDYRNIGQFFKNLFNQHSIYGLKRLWLIPILLIVLISMFGAATSPDHQINSSQRLQRNIHSNQLAMKANNQRVLKKQHSVSPSINLDQPLTNKQQQTKKYYQLTKKQILLAHNYQVTAIGDSILADSSDDLHNVFPNAYISAAVGRQIWQASGVLNQLKQRNELSKNIIINLGTNSPMTSAQINQTLSVIGSKRNVYWINCHVPTRNWEQQVNETINHAAKTHPNVHVINWYQYSYNHPEYFWDDHVHPNPLGNRKFTSLIAKNIFKD
ncbi:acyltransferase family protein [Philodulcilactobacillus myokoensis]|nr:acyltransferase family protein [Philodulcilactobacillus myokoensis]